MSIWELYPADYRQREITALAAAVRAGECVSVVGLSGAGKSNLLGFVAGRVTLPDPGPRFVLVDCNRLAGSDPGSFYRLLHSTLTGQASAAPAGGAGAGPAEALSALDAALQARLATSNLCLLFDRFDAIVPGSTGSGALLSNLRALRDAYKYALTYVTATRRPLDPATELAELFYSNILWLGPLSVGDARWSVARYAQRKGLEWPAEVVAAMVRLSGGYPAFLRAACEAYAGGAALELEALRAHPAVQQRLGEFWADRPSAVDLENSGLAGHPFLSDRPALQAATLWVDPAQLTAKEYLLLAYLQAHPGQVCAKDDLIQAVWPEDRVLGAGLRDDSLAQLVRRLRKKVEADPSNPRWLHTVPGRGYRYTPPKEA